MQCTFPYKNRGLSNFCQFVRMFTPLGKTYGPYINCSPQFFPYGKICGPFFIFQFLMVRKFSSLALLYGKIGGPFITLFLSGNFPYFFIWENFWTFFYFLIFLSPQFFPIFPSLWEIGGTFDLSFFVCKFYIHNLPG
jgi:hypothetical protein